MGDENQSEDTTQAESPGPHPAAGHSMTDESRRRFAKAGLVGSAVILTLTSRPVLGWGYGGGHHGGGCQAPSGFCSGNVSPHGPYQKCYGRTPGYWKTQPHWDEWPSPYECGTCSGQCNHVHHWKNDGTKFKDVFSCIGYGKEYAGYYEGGGKFYPYSLIQVLWMTGNQDSYQLGAHIVAALLNAEKGWTPVLKVQNVTDIWNEYDAKGYFEPTATVKWYPEDIVNYLQSTMS